MSSKTNRRTKMPIQLTFCRTKRFFHKTLINLKSFISCGSQTLPNAPTIKPIFSCNSKINSLELDNFCRSFSERWDSIEAVIKKEGHLSPKGDEECKRSSMNVAERSGLKDLKEDNYSSYLSADALVKKMKELEMMDLKDMDHVLDVEEVLHYYSRLTCPAYVEIVDKFFMDMYSELHAPQPSRSVNSSMRKLGSVSVHSSMRSLGPLKL